MGSDTGISWTDATWNPIRGCSRVSAGCVNCYAERVARRFSGPGQPYAGLINAQGRWNGTVRMIAEHLADPLRWRKPRRIFVNSMSDLFHDALPNEQIAAVFGVMAAAPQHTFQVLTKRADRMREWFAWARGEFTMQQRGIAEAPHTFHAMLDAAYEILGKPSKPALDAAWRLNRDDVWPLPNVWLGVSVENQDAADERIPDLLKTPAAVRFLSCEPLIGPVDLRGVEAGNSWSGGDWLRSWRFEREHDDGRREVLEERKERIDWVIAGCESGPGARSCEVAWLRSLRDQCAAAGVAFFLKQATRLRGTDGESGDMHRIEIGRGSKEKSGGVIELPYLDGEQHVAFPEVRHGE